MDHVTPLYPPSKFASAYCDMQDGERNLLYLFGLAGLLALVERENAAVPSRHALDVHAIAHVVRAWADCESDTWSGGFVLELNDGSRVYLEGYESVDGGPTRLPLSCRCRPATIFLIYRPTTAQTCSGGARRPSLPSSCAALAKAKRRRVASAYLHDLREE